MQAPGSGKSRLIIGVVSMLSASAFLAGCLSLPSLPPKPSFSLEEDAKECIPIITPPMTCKAENLARFSAMLKTPDMGKAFSDGKVPADQTSPNITCMRARKAGGSIAVHPPKFFQIYAFLRGWMTCQEAFQMLSIYLVFSSQEDLDLFNLAVECQSPGIPHVWTSVVVVPPEDGWDTGGAANQFIAAYKKWYGIFAMMDLGTEEYGLMLDSELSIYDFFAKNGTETACKPNGSWSRLLERIQEREAAKEFPAARVNETLSVYKFDESFSMNGKSYDQALISENAAWSGWRSDCTLPECLEIQRQIDLCLFSWWTDLPWMNLTTVARLLALQGGMEPLPRGQWRNWSTTQQRFPRFEYIGYQQLCVLYDGWRFRDVTNITRDAKWGSYLEDPIPGSQLGQLKPLWVSAETIDRAEGGVIGPLSREEPPLLIFHADHVPRFTYGWPGLSDAWNELMADLIQLQNRTDYFTDEKK